MELRSTEAEIQSLRTLYNSLIQSLQTSPCLVPQPCVTTTSIASTTDSDNVYCCELHNKRHVVLPPLQIQSEAEQGFHPTTSTTTKTTATISSSSSISLDDEGRRFSAVEVLERIEGMCQRVKQLKVPTQKFQKRLKDKDPVTNQSRYGPQTKQRVQTILELYQDLVNVLEIIFGDNNIVSSMVHPNSQSTTTPFVSLSTTTTTNGLSTNSNHHTIFQILQECATMERIHEQHRIHQEQIQHQSKERAHQMELELNRRNIEAAETERIRQEQLVLTEQAQREHEAQMVRQQAQERLHQQDRDWFNSIPHRKTLQGVQGQLNVLAKNSSSRESLSALQTIFSQIVAHPEEVNYRRIRRDHPRFVQDIGQYEGGRELLIAAGFELGLVEEVPSFVCKEPNIEKDMDGWVAWFDLLKVTLDLIEKAIMEFN